MKSARSGGKSSSSTRNTNSLICVWALRAWSARISVSSLTRSRGLLWATWMIEAAGHGPIWGSLHREPPLAHHRHEQEEEEQQQDDRRKVRHGASIRGWFSRAFATTRHRFATAANVTHPVGSNRPAAVRPPRYVRPAIRNPT